MNDLLNPIQSPKNYVAPLCSIVPNIWVPRRAMAIDTSRSV